MATETTKASIDYDSQLSQAWDVMHKIEQDFEHLVGHPLRGRGASFRSRGLRRRPMGSFAGMRSRFVDINESMRRDQTDAIPRGDPLGFRERGIFRGSGFDRPSFRGRTNYDDLGSSDGARRYNFGRPEIRERTFAWDSDFNRGFGSRRRMDESRENQMDFGFRRAAGPSQNGSGAYMDRYDNRRTEFRGIQRYEPVSLRGRRHYEDDGVRYGPTSPEARNDDDEWVEKPRPGADGYVDQPPAKRINQDHAQTAQLRFRERYDSQRHEEPRRRRLEENYAPRSNQRYEQIPTKVSRRTSKHSPIRFNESEQRREKSPVVAAVTEVRPRTRKVRIQKAPIDIGTTVQRNKKLFTNILTTLQTFDKEKPEGYMAQEKKIKEVADRLEVEHEEATKKMMEEKRKILDMRYQQRLEIRRLSKKRSVAVACQSAINHLKLLQNFIMTNTKPHVYYLPAKHTIRTMELHKKTQKQLEENISSLNQEMEVRLKSIDEETHIEQDENDEDVRESGEDGSKVADIENVAEYNEQEATDDTVKTDENVAEDTSATSLLNVESKVEPKEEIAYPKDGDVKIEHELLVVTEQTVPDNNQEGDFCEKDDAVYE